MTRQEKAPRRAAFTLIELLIVIAIIAVLASLTVAAVVRFLVKGPELQAQNDMLQLSNGISLFKQQFHVDYIPSKAVLRERHTPQSLSALQQPNATIQDRQELATLNYLARMFGSRFNPLGPHDWTGRWGGPQNVPAIGGGITNPQNPRVGDPIVLEGQECLVFFLGGIPLVENGNMVNEKVIGMTGFSFSPSSPTVPGGERRGPFFDFKVVRLKGGIGNPFPNSLSAGRMPVYLDPFENDVPMPYAFFSSAKGGYNQWGLGLPNSDCRTLGLIPYYQTVQGQAPNLTFRYHNHDGFQIISAGADGKFGQGGLLTPGAATTDDDAKDNLVNFSRFKLGAENRD